MRALQLCGGGFLTTSQSDLMIYRVDCDLHSSALLFFTLGDSVLK